jgi:uncharacterized protein (DUF2267 family)
MVTGADMFNKALQDANAWLNEAMGDLDADRHRAYHALRAVLHATRDRLSVRECHDLAAQLPMLLRGLYFEGYTPAGKPLDSDFLPAVAEGLRDGQPLDPADAARAVFRLLDDNVARGQIEEVKRQLPADAFVLWPRRVAGSRRDRF